MLKKFEVDPDENPDFYDYVDANIYYKVINGSLRQRRLTPYLFKKINRIVDTIEALPGQEQEGVSYRGVGKDLFQGLGVGDTFLDYGFVSSSHNLTTASDFAGKNGVILQINWAEGTKLAYNGNESEFISLPMVEFEIIDTDQWTDLRTKIKYRKLIVEANSKFHRRKLSEMIDETIEVEGEIDLQYYVRIAEKLKISLDD